jgi:starch-binding outer membrane protein, SusD/RagB family
MKIIMKNIIVVFIFSFFVLGCESILDEEPQSIIDPERFYNTETDGIAAIAGIYSHIMNGDAFGINLDIYFDVNHDLLTPTRALGAGQEFYAYKWDENTPRIRAIWQRMYQAVNDANWQMYS